VNETTLFFRFGVALVIGILVGLQREYAFGEPGKELFAGVRTFALMGLIGCTAALATDLLASPWPFVAILLIVGILLTVSYFIDAWRGAVGLTTEAAALLTVLVGALVYWDYMALAVALGVATTVLLSVKLEMQRLVEQITREDIYATLKFAVVTAIVLPILPDQAFGPPPFDVLNPYKIWLLVVFISGISFVGYIAIKVIGPGKGIGLTGLLGGLASSTALTLSFTQRSKANKALARPFALAIMMAWTVMFSRVVVEVAAVNAVLVPRLWLPLAIPVTVGLGYSLYLYISQPSYEKEEVSFSNPFELGPAIKFGLLFTAILLISRAAQVFLGASGIYLSSFVSGLADVDAIALSLAELSRQPGGIDHALAARAIVLAAVANTLSKGGIVLIGGSSPLRRAILPGFLLMLVTGILAILII
jgi:uncharacterized membrane protein (DUF4010 family)